ncbi:DUF2634 domain-containing protein [Peptostreptococcus sp. D1]|uniref:DUF2634 domain-containing protein n=1 Tax=Peptostreptococcus sp. D1 TaxID=72304 RepID=UPI0008F0CAC1|nr:DUF2634 domain-containing protein [Peptostreptococcus sp. D1]SFE87666.1 Protein of unknown function [Peptostreptococcus sp. D1]
MSNFPFVGVESDYGYNTINELPNPKEMKISYDSGEVILDDTGNIAIVEGLEAIKIWCYLAIKTQRFNHNQIFSSDYGSEHRKLIGWEYSKELTETEAYRYIKDCLMANPYINDIRNMGVNRKADKLYINIEIDTKYGNEKIEGVI